jgi:hypothetical protein
MDVYMYLLVLMTCGFVHQSHTWVWGIVDILTGERKPELAKCHTVHHKSYMYSYFQKGSTLASMVGSRLLIRRQTKGFRRN